MTEIQRRPDGTTVIAGRSEDLARQLAALRAAGQIVQVLDGQKSSNNPDVWLARVRVLDRPARGGPDVPLHRYVPAWVWAAGLLLAAGVAGAGVWLVHELAVAAAAHMGQIVTVALVAVMALGGGGCCLAAAAKGHGH